MLFGDRSCEAVVGGSDSALLTGGAKSGGRGAEEAEEAEESKRPS